MIAEGILLSPETTEMIVYAVILLFGGEKALQMKRKRTDGDTLTDGKAIVAKIAALEKAIEDAKEDIEKIAHVAEAVAALREAVNTLKDSVRDMWDEIKDLRRAG